MTIKAVNLLLESTSIEEMDPLEDHEFKADFLKDVYSIYSGRSKLRMAITNFSKVVETKISLYYISLNTDHLTMVDSIFEGRNACFS